MKTLRRSNNYDSIVKYLQGLLHLAEDGFFGPVTEEAVIQFQKDHGLQHDGVVGPKTWAALQAGIRLPESSRRRINEIIIHCTDTPEGRDVSIAQVRQWHTEPTSKGGRGWSDVGYHFLVRLDGRVENGRDVNKIGAHCLGHNSHSIGICYVGGRGKDGKIKDTRTPSQILSLKKLVAMLCARFAIPEDAIFGHNEFANKSCPCFDVGKEFRNK